MKYYILGLDGLEYNLVEKWNLRGLQQQVCNKIWVPIGPNGIPESPQCWGTFLTGKVIERRPLARTWYKTVVKKAVAGTKRISRSVGLALAQLTKGWSHVQYPSLRGTTFLDWDGAKPVNAPYYDFDEQTLKVIERYYLEEWSADSLLDSYFQLLRNRRKQLAAEVSSASTVVFAYTHVPDVVQHIAWSKTSVLKRLYRELNELANDIRLRLNSATPLIIVSDHGSDLEGSHSEYGFFSSSHTLPHPIKAITDFFPLFKEALT
jgi:hypothetical protein